MASSLPKRLLARLGRVKILFCDVDGVLTDGTVLVGEGGEFKAFHIQDGLGLRLLQREGIRVAWVSNRPSTATQRRADELNVDFLHQAKGSKVEAVGKDLRPGGFCWGGAAL